MKRTAGNIEASIMPGAEGAADGVEPGGAGDRGATAAAHAQAAGIYGSPHLWPVTGCG